MVLEVLQNGLHFCTADCVRQVNRMTLPFEIFNPDKTCLVRRVHRRGLTTYVMALSAFVDEYGFICPVGQIGKGRYGEENGK